MELTDFYALLKNDKFLNKHQVAMKTDSVLHEHQ